MPESARAGGGLSLATGVVVRALGAISGFGCVAVVAGCSAGSVGAEPVPPSPALEGTFFAVSAPEGEQIAFSGDRYVRMPADCVVAGCEERGSFAFSADGATLIFRGDDGRVREATFEVVEVYRQGPTPPARGGSADVRTATQVTSPDGQKPLLGDPKKLTDDVPRVSGAIIDGTQIRLLDGPKALLEPVPAWPVPECYYTLSKEEERRIDDIAEVCAHSSMNERFRTIPRGDYVIDEDFTKRVAARIRQRNRAFAEQCPHGDELMAKLGDAAARYAKSKGLQEHQKICAAACIAANWLTYTPGWRRLDSEATAAVTGKAQCGGYATFVVALAEWSGVYTIDVAATKNFEGGPLDHAYNVIVLADGRKVFFEPQQGCVFRE
jgi:hypothetical protein